MVAFCRLAVQVQILFTKNNDSGGQQKYHRSGFSPINKQREIQFFEKFLFLKSVGSKTSSQRNQ